MSPASVLLLLPVLPVVFALVLLVGSEPIRRRAALPVGLVAGLCLAASLLAPVGSLALPKLLVEATSFLTLNATSRAILLLCGSLWLSCALAWPGDREEDTLAGPLLLIALAGAATLALAEGGSLVFASLIGIGYALYARVLITSSDVGQRGGRALVVLLVTSDVLLFELLLDLAAHLSAPPGTRVWLLALAATVLRGAIPPAHGWLPMALAGARPADAAILASLPPAAAVLGISRMLPTAEPSVAQAMAGLGAVGAFAAAALALTRRDARSTLGYASASTAAVLLGGLPALLGEEAGDATAWHVVALTAPLAVPSLAAACPHRRRRDVILSSAVAVHALAGASFAHAASAAAPGWPAAGAQLAAVVATLSFALAARASRGMPQDEPISAGVATIPLLAAAGALVLTPAPDPSLVWAWGGMPMLIALLIVWRFRRPAEPEARSLHVPTGDLVALAERFGRGLARRLTPIFNERLPQRRDRVADALGAWFVDPRWAAACEQIEAGLARWTVTSVLILAAAITITWLFVP